MDRPDRPRSACRAAAAALLCVSLFLALGCASEQDTELQRTHAYMDSLRVYLGELRLMDYELGEVVSGDTVDAAVIVPIIASDLRPTVSGLRTRADALTPTPPVRQAHTLLLAYLDARLQAYDAALQGASDERPELFDLFARKQVEAQAIGDDLEDEAQRLASQVPGYR